MHHVILPCCSVQSLMQGRHAALVVSLDGVVVSTAGGSISMDVVVSTAGGSISMGVVVSTAGGAISMGVVVSTAGAAISMYAVVVSTV